LQNNLSAPQFVHTAHLRIFIDPDLLQCDGVNDFVWAAAGTWNDNFAIAPSDLVRISGGVITDLKRA
jgi:prolyl-tRNA editing enzyme YbaK/EbsC (Cys-tRNA(Pro) deacylase)